MPPRWTVEPVDANVAAGQEAIIHCQAEGYPTPTITWKKAIGKFNFPYKNNKNLSILFKFDYRDKIQ